MATTANASGEEAKGGTETSLVLTNDGTGVQDIGLLTELLEHALDSQWRLRCSHGRPGR